MRVVTVALLSAVLALVGCATVDTTYADYVWEHRAEFIYDNPNFDRDRKESEVYLVGAAREADPNEVAEDIEANLPAEDDESEEGDDE